MSEGTFENDGVEAEGQEPEGLATGAGPTESDSHVQDEIEDKAEEAKESTDDQHLGDAMDDVDLEPKSS